MNDISTSVTQGSPISLAVTDDRQTSDRIQWQPSAVVGLAVFGLIVLGVAAAPLLAQYDPSDQVLVDRLLPLSPSHFLGTDALGRDVWSRLLHGGRFSLTIAAVSVLISAAIGTVLGAVAGRRGGVVDEVSMRLVDLFISFPQVIVALMLISFLKPGVGPLILAMTITSWTPYARLVRAVVLEINTQAYIEAAVATGAPEWLILWKHVLPNTLGPVLAMIFLRFGHALLTIAGLSYLGMGAQPPTPDWGVMLSEALPYMQRAPSLILVPGLIIFVTTLSVTFAGQGLTLMLDPQQQRSQSK